MSQKAGGLAHQPQRKLKSKVSFMANFSAFLYTWAFPCTTIQGEKIYYYDHVGTQKSAPPTRAGQQEEEGKWFWVFISFFFAQLGFLREYMQSISLNWKSQSSMETHTHSLLYLLVFFQTSIRGWVHLFCNYIFKNFATLLCSRALVTWGF